MGNLMKDGKRKRAFTRQICYSVTY